MLGGVEVALPARDHGIDLVAYLALETVFIACPIQMKAAMGRAFSIDAKYWKFPDLLHAFVWNIGQETEIYALNQSEAVAVADHMGYTKTRSWLAGEYYTNTRAGKKLSALLKPFLMKPELWKGKITSAMLPH